MNKIHGEHTRPTNLPPLCDTCSAATIVRGTRFGDDVIRCHVLGRVSFHVTACNSYTDARLTPIYRLEETAWRWMPDLNRMVSPGELMRLQQVSAAPPASQGQGAVSMSAAVDPVVESGQEGLRANPRKP
jgi:hypothetical protein